MSDLFQRIEDRRAEHDVDVVVTARRIRDRLAEILQAFDDRVGCRAAVFEEDDAVLADGRLLAQQERLDPLCVVNSACEVPRCFLIFIDAYKKSEKP